MAGVDFIVEVNPKDFKKFTNVIESQIVGVNKDTAEDLGKFAVKQLSDLTSAWRHTVEFEVETEGRKGDITLLVSTDDEIFKFLDKGTRVRRAIMSPDFVPKTTVGSLQSKRGRGGVVFISKKVNRPGIKARKFSERVTRNVDARAEQTFNRNFKKRIK